MTALVKKDDDFMAAIHDMEQTQAMCDKLLQHKHYQKLGPEGIYALVAKAKSLGISPLEALNGGLYFVSGKVGMSSETMASLIRQAGHSIVKDPKSDNTICILHGKRKDNGDTWTCVFSMEDAKRAGLAKNMYEKYPAIMLYNRCMSMLARQLFPDVIKGCGYELSELKEIAKIEEFKPEPTTSEIIVKPVAMQVKAPAEVKKPTKEEIEQLKDILSQCDPEFEKDYVSGDKAKIKAIPGVTSLDDMSVSAYIRLLDLANKNKAEYMKKIMGDADDDNDVERNSKDD